MTMTKPYCYDYPRPAVTVDLVVFALADDGLRMLLIRRKHDPFAGKLAIPGGFLNMDEPVETAARRELHEETGLADVGQLGFLGYFDAPNRDPRGRTISFAFVATIPGPPPKAGTCLAGGGVDRLRLVQPTLD
jgi:8-oxo-dGTP diphosphatase